MARERPPILWLFEDQLSPELPVLEQHPGSPVVLIESARNMRRVAYHKVRLAFLVSAMRHFVLELRGGGREVWHYGLKERAYKDSLSAMRDAARRAGTSRVIVMRPSEHHTQAWLDEIGPRLELEIEYVPNTMFLTDRDEFSSWARSVKSPVMEPFYRKMRREHKVLMDGDEPVGGAWNFDKENRKRAPQGLLVPPVPRFEPDEITRGALADVEAHFALHPGSTEGFALPVTREDARRALKDFIKNRLPFFGDFEDAMVGAEPVLYHSMLSAPINAGLLTPMECVRAAEKAYRDGLAPLNAVEGFVRQLIGWREYVYGIYWAFMPGYIERNARGDARPLPRFFWDGDTEMNCLRGCVRGVLDRAYTHHIQRLMVICNFATLAGLSPRAVNDWFLQMYVDSHEWVVTPNVIGMGMNADGGTMATKPYVSSAAYIDRMSDSCGGCRFDPKKRTGADACPFNALFWGFLHEHRAALGANPRMTMMLRNLERIGAGELEQILRSRREFLAGLG